MEKWEAAYIAGIIDGEGSITLTKNHKNEMRRPLISISSNDLDMLTYIQNLVGGNIIRKKNYNPLKHQNSYLLSIKSKKEVFTLLEEISPYLRITKKRKRAVLILERYNKVTPRNGKYTEDLLNKKLKFEEEFYSF